MLKISNPEKILFPGGNITKKEFVEYYDWIWPIMQDYIKDRPVSLERYPDGIDHESFYQKETPAYYPSYVKRAIVEDDHKTMRYAMINNRQSIDYIANMASIPIHTWQSRLKTLEYPDQVIWDLDPSDDDFKKVRIGAKLLKYFLEELGLQPWLKFTGSKGVHITVPLEAEYDYAAIKAFSGSVATFMASKLPELFTIELRKSKRHGRIFVDYLRNQFGHTAAAPYSVRALQGAPVAAPITWDELDDKRMNPQSFNIRNIRQRLEEKGDLWKGIYKQAQSLKAPMKNMEEILERQRFRRLSA
jgi:bifunctional non-homologous end joining protein LigD